jgi:hypothetical protein
MFSTKRLYCNLNNLLLSYVNTPLLLIKITIDKKYKIRKIIAIKLTKEKLTY